MVLLDSNVNRKRKEKKEVEEYHKKQKGIQVLVELISGENGVAIFFRLEFKLKH